MSKSKKWVMLSAFLWLSVFGTLLHFVYDWSGKNAFAGLFSNVNESTWEHLKLLFFPAAFFVIAAFPFLHKKHPAFFTAFICAALCGMLTIVTLFYTYTGILGQSFNFVNIAIFFIAAAVTACLGTQWSFRWKNAGSLWGLAILTLVAILFFRFTAQPPDLGIFQPPQ